MNPSIKMIIAVDENNAIGWADGSLPWKSPHDMKRFKELTTGSTVIMGRKTYESLKRPNGLPDRKNRVLTQQSRIELLKTGQHFGIASIIHSLDYVELNRGLEEQWIIGGASVYAEALERRMVDELYVTQVHVNSGADVSLPFELYSWKLFVLQQRKLGTNWDLVDMQVPTVVHPSPGISFLTFRKIP